MCLVIFTVPVVLSLIDLGLDLAHDILDARDAFRAIQKQPNREKQHDN